jgi:hypothetical protein
MLAMLRQGKLVGAHLGDVVLDVFDVTSLGKKGSP